MASVLHMNSRSARTAADHQKEAQTEASLHYIICQLIGWNVNLLAEGLVVGPAGRNTYPVLNSHEFYAYIFINSHFIAPSQHFKHILGYP